MSTATATEERNSWIPMIAIALGQAIMSFNVASLPVAMGGMVESFGTPPTTVATGIVVYSMIVSGFVMLGAKLVQRFGALRVFRIAVLFFGGVLSHVVNKRPVPGDFRVQEEFGGHYTLLPEPPAGALALARRTLAAVDAPLLYARIDVVPDGAGGWWLMEAELIEPDFYLKNDPRAGAGFGKAVRERLGL